jgi:purine-binding chemotaxis protein CheW
LAIWSTKSCSKVKIPQREADVLPFLTFSLGKQLYALPIDQVVEVVAMVELVTVPDTPPAFLGAANRRGSVLPVLDLRPVFQQEATPITPATLFIVAADGKREAGLVVDEVLQVVYFSSDQVSGASVREQFVLGIIPHQDQLVQFIALPALLTRLLPDGFAEKRMLSENKDQR